MVALRVAIGWHFFSEGVSHKQDAKWSSEGFLRQAKGPLAELYTQHLPSFHNFDRLVLIPLAPDSRSSEDAAKLKPQESPIYGNWFSEILRDWDSRRKDIANFYKFNDEQQKASCDVLDRSAKQLEELLAADEADIREYRHQLWRNGQMSAEQGADDIPNRKARLSKRAAGPTGEPGISVDSSPAQWRSDVEALGAAREKAVADLATEDQKRLGPAPPEPSELKKIDTVVIWLLIVAGGCLMLGLFTRISALALALFLASVIATQPPWVPGAVTMLFNYQLVELLALLVLATSHVGRWGGLDFFVHHLLLRPFRKTEPTT
jgi:uncharacterized membrane protein YphA (DoxX/SURF4 family)